ncbi:MAG: endo-1,4-beta-xylanase [Bacteroidetes bacterium]|nr:endo-1,4-beta-xylanase [Bacteroidota bacterium]
MKPKLVLFIALLLGAWTSCRKEPLYPVVEKEHTLRELAETNGLFYIGSSFANNIAVNSIDREQYKKVVGEEFNYLQCEWDMSMEAVWTSRYEYNFEWCDNVADYAIAHNMKLRGAHLIWHGALPEWDITTLSNAEFEIAVKEYMDTLMTHFMVKYPGLISEWNVVNEVIDHDGIVNAGESRLRPSIFLDKMGPDFVKKAFTWAHQADPSAKLYICEYDFLGNETDNKGKADLLYNLVTELLSDNVPIHGVAEQMHLDTDPEMGFQDLNYYSTTMDRFGNLGLDFQITECTITIKNGVGTLKERLQEQADIIRNVMLLCKTKPYFTGFSFWGFVDTHSHLSADEYPLLFDENYVPKPCYFSVYEVLQ